MTSRRPNRVELIPGNGLDEDDFAIEAAPAPLPPGLFEIAVAHPGRKMFGGFARGLVPFGNGAAEQCPDGFTFPPINRAPQLGVPARFRFETKLCKHPKALLALQQKQATTALPGKRPEPRPHDRLVRQTLRSNWLRLEALGCSAFAVSVSTHFGMAVVVHRGVLRHGNDGRQDEERSFRDGAFTSRTPLGCCVQESVPAMESAFKTSSMALLANPTQEMTTSDRCNSVVPSDTTIE